MKKIPALIAVSVFLLASLFFVESVFAGAWTVPKYKVWSEYYTRWDYGKDSYNAEWTRQSDRDSGAKNFRDWRFTQEPKLEYGVTDWLTAMTSVEFVEAHYKEYDRRGHSGMPSSSNPIFMEQYSVKNKGVKAVKVGGRWRLMDVPFVLSSQTRVFIYPGYGINHGDFRRAGVIKYEDRENLPDIEAGGSDSVEERAMIGKTFSIPLSKTYKLPCYGGAEFGYRWYNRGVCNAYVWFLEGGFWPFPWLLLKSELDAYKTHDGTGRFEKAYGILRFGGVWQVFGGDSVLRQGSKLFNLEFEYGMTIWGKNTTAYEEFIFKVQTQF